MLSTQYERVQISFVIAALWLLVGCDKQNVADVPHEKEGPPPSFSVSSPSENSNDPTREDAVTVADLSVVPSFTDVAKEVGIDFTFVEDARPDRFFLPEVMGGGAAWIDFDLDGWLDLYLANGAALDPQAPLPETPSNRLYRSLAAEHFSDITGAAHAGDASYSQGCAVGDFDADGFPDLYVTSYGPNVLYHNNGDGTFSDITTRAGVGDPNWGTSAAWFDADSDGDLDLYVANYLDVTLANSQVCQYNEKPGYCGPGSYEAVPDLCYINQGDGEFRDAAEALGFTAPGGKGLAVSILDLDDDLLPEVYVANDMMPNFLFTRSQSAQQTASGGTPERLYSEIAFRAGCATSDTGQNEASMGLACADFDGNLLVDLYLTHYYSHKNTLYANLGNLAFIDDSYRTRVAATSYETLGFGTSALDFDRDGAWDIFVANGHVLGPLQTPSEMPPQLLHNDGRGRFDDISLLAGAYFHDKWLGRGVAAADYDNDGDLDLLVTHIHRPVVLLRNDTACDRHFLGLALHTPDRVDGMGGRIVVHLPDRELVLPLTSGGSYLCSSDSRCLAGLDSATVPPHLTIYWPSGRRDELQAPAHDRYWHIWEGADSLRVLEMPSP